MKKDIIIEGFAKNEDDLNAIKTEVGGSGQPKADDINGGGQKKKQDYALTL